MKLLTNFLIILVPLTILAVLIPSLIASDFFQKELLEKSKTELANKSYTTINSVSRFMFERIADIKQLQNLNINSPYQEIKDLERFSRAYSHISIFDTTGNLSFNSRNILLPSLQVTNPLFQEALNGKIVFESVPKFSEFTKTSEIRFFGPIYENSEIKGIVVASVSLGKITELVSNSFLELENTKFAFITKDAEPLIKGTFGDAKTTKNILQHLALQNFLKSNDEMTDILFEERIVHGVTDKGFLDYPGNSWYLITYVDKQDIFEDSQIAQQNFFTFSGIVIVIIIAVLIVVTNRITKPITELRKHTNSIVENKYEEKLKLHGVDEIQELEDDFNKMIDSIKENIALEVELTKTKEKIKNERLTTIGELSARIAHDIRNPLATLKNSVEILDKTVPPENEMTSRAISRSNTAIDRISHQVDEVLDFLRDTPLHLEKKPVRHIIKSVVKSIPIPDNIQVHLPENNVEIQCDRLKIDRVFTNIILNAVQAIDDKPGNIKIRILDQTDTVKIEIEDDGPGIPEEDISKIFEPLYTTKQQGTGLGLAGCKNILQQHGGDITVKPNPVIFEVILPKEQKSENNSA